MKEKFVTFPQDHQLPSKDELRGKVYCKYHNSWNHSTKSCGSFKNVIQDKVNKEVILKFPVVKKVTMKPLGEKEAMVIDEDPFSLLMTKDVYMYENMAKGRECGKYSKIDFKSKHAQKNLNEKYYQHSTPFHRCTGHTSSKLDSRSSDIVPTRIEGSF